MPQMPIPLPYNLKRDQLVISQEDVGEPSTWSDIEDTNTAWGDAALGYITDNLSWSDEEMMERIFRAAVCLYHTPESPRPFGKCLAQAIVWEVG